jgi:RHS repeat-associated protein
MKGKFIWICVSVFLLVAASSAYAQWTKAMPGRGRVPGASFDGTGLESVNMVNGNVLLNIPLTSLPAGDAGSSVDLSLTYNSAIYETTTQYLQVIDPYTLNATGWVPVDRLMPSYYPIWTLGYSYGLILEQRAVPPTEFSVPNPYNTLAPKSILPIEAVFNYRVRAVFPDGSLHTLYLEDNHGLGAYGDQDTGEGGGWYAYNPGYRYNNDPNVSNRSWGLDSLQAQLNARGSSFIVPSLSGTLSYYTNDGTRIRLTINTSNNWVNQQWTMYLSDGRKVKGHAGTTDYIYDRNDNEIQIAHDIASPCPGAPTESCPVDTISDRYGRSIQIRPPITNSNITIITQTGAEGSQLQWQVTWNTTNTSFEYTCKVQGIYEPVDGSCTINAGFANVINVSLPGFTSPLSYGFEYNNPISNEYPGGFNPYWSTQGRLTDINLPYSLSGAEAKIHYAYQGYAPYQHLMDNPVIYKKVFYRDAETLAQIVDIWNYDHWYALDGAGDYNSVVNPDGGIERHYPYGLYNYWSAQLAGHIYKIEYSDGSRLENVWGWKQINADGDNPYVKMEVRSVASAGAPSQAAVKSYTYSINGNLLSSNEYDWIPYSSILHNGGMLNDNQTGLGSPVRRTEQTYYVNVGETATGNSNEYWKSTSPGLLTAVHERKILSNSVVKSWSIYTYDDATSKGNVIGEWRYDDAVNNNDHAITLSYSYDQKGNPLTEINARGIVKTLVYDHSPFPSVIPYPVELHEADGMSEQRDWEFTWDLYTGLRKSEKDLNNGVTLLVSYDPRGRQILFKEGSKDSVPVDQTGLRQTYTAYNDSPSIRTVTAYQDLSSPGDRAIQTKTTMDNRGRIWKTETTDDNGQLAIQTLNYERVCDSGGVNCPTAAPGDQGFTYRLSSNPFRSSNDETMGWTRTKLDKMDRVLEVAYFEGASKPAPWGNNTGLSGAMTTSYDSYSQTITDEAGKTRIFAKDGLGRLHVVTESGVSTTYSYDLLDNLTGVDQGGQLRSFVYTSLTRLEKSTNPENGTYCYGYDKAGNLITKTHPAGQSCPSPLEQGDYVSMAYDNLNRITTKTYHDGTPTAIFQYGAVGVLNSPDCPNNGTNYTAGRLTSVSNSVSSYTYKCYDALGRVLRGTQSTSGLDYTLSYHYMPSFMDSITYPSGRVVSYNQTSRGLVKEALGYTSSSNSITYTPSGSFQSVTLGSGVVETRGYNGRLQMRTLDAVKSGVTKLSLVYSYPSGTNNGNPSTQRIVYPAGSGEAAFDQTQSYTYDAFNRLHIFSEGSTSRTYDYDTWGNLWASAHTGLELSASTPTSSNFVSNRLGSASYDGHGNQTSLGFFTLAYNGEDQQKSAVSASGSASYEYDGEGRRVRKLTCSGSSSCTDATSGVVKTVFVYDASGQLMAEYFTTASLSGREYNTTDQLGSIRLVTDTNGNVVRRYDYIPFGEEIPQGINGRSTKYPVASGSSDDQSKKFTGKERDAETGLDYFGARYLSGAQGRFTTVDPSMQSAVLQNPQSWNRYSYALNNPLLYVDPTGELWVSSGNANNPYSWVDKCNLDQTCYEAIAASLNGNLRIYGASSKDDISIYDQNKTHMVDLGEVAANDDSKFSLKNPKMKDRFTTSEAAAAWFNATYDFASTYGNTRFVVTAASLENGEGGPLHPDSHGWPNAGIDFRYFDMSMQTTPSSKSADAGKMFSIFNSAVYWGFNQTVSGRPVFFGTGPKNVHSKDYQKLVNEHQNHGHVGIVERLRPPSR